MRSFTQLSCGGGGGGGDPRVGGWILGPIASASQVKNICKISCPSMYITLNYIVHSLAVWYCLD